MKRIAAVFSSLLLVAAQLAAEESQRAFPGAEGFGAYAKGGRGGDVYVVTNTHDSGLGSFREGIASADGPRTIVFAVSGLIDLESPLTLDKDYMTVAGQTAPGDGICLKNYTLVISADHIVVRYIRSRLGDAIETQADALSIRHGSNIIIDHCSASWSIDETLSSQSGTVSNLTVQWCMVTESLTNSFHEKGSHGYGGIAGGNSTSYHHNLFAHHTSRTPKVTGRRHCLVDFRNNVIYNWGYNNCYDGTASYLNWVNNYYKAGPGTKDEARRRIFRLSDEDIRPGGSNIPQDSKEYETSLYAHGNYVVGYPNVSRDNWKGGIEFEKGATGEKNRAHAPHDCPEIMEQAPDIAYQLVLESAGASLARDRVDARIVEEVREGNAPFGVKGHIDSPADVGGYPEYRSAPAPKDSDSDGIPEAVERQYGLDPNDPSDGNEDPDKDGYTNLERYLNSLVGSNGLQGYAFNF